MKNIKWPFLFLAILAGLSMVAVGISLAEGSVIGAIISIVLLISVFGIGFSMKRKMIRNEQL